MSAAQRLGLVGIVLAGLWALTILVISEVAP
jgi:hypothetical protein